MKTKTRFCKTKNQKSKRRLRRRQAPASPCRRSSAVAMSGGRGPRGHRGAAAGTGTDLEGILEEN